MLSSTWKTFCGEGDQQQTLCVSYHKTTIKVSYGIQNKQLHRILMSQMIYLFKRRTQQKKQSASFTAPEKYETINQKNQKSYTFYFSS